MQPELETETADACRTLCPPNQVTSGRTSRSILLWFQLVQAILAVPAIQAINDEYAVSCSGRIEASLVLQPATCSQSPIVH
jgi:hypothetical protein